VLGHVLEVEIEGAVFRWPRGQVELLWHPGARCLCWFDADEIPLEPDDETNDRAAALAYARFKDRDAKTLRTAEYPVGGQWRSYGRARRIDYFSDKWDERASYTHDLGHRVVLYRQGPTRGPWLFVLRGGRLRCTHRGIEG
jgi:hypothetical protein